MFGSLGVPELIFIFALALLIFGPRKLPEIGRTIGRGLSEFRKASTDLKRSINTEMIEEELRESDPTKVLDDKPAATSGSQDRDASDVKGEDEAGEQPVAATAESRDGTAPEGSVPRGAAGDAPAATTDAGRDAERAPGATETP